MSKFKKISHLHNGCSICHLNNYTYASDHVCPHKRFEAYKTLAFLKFYRNDINECDGMIIALQNRTPEMKKSDDDQIEKDRELIRLHSIAYCTCPVQDTNCVCGAVERYASLPGDNAKYHSQYLATRGDPHELPEM